MIIIRCVTHLSTCASMRDERKVKLDVTVYMLLCCSLFVYSVRCKHEQYDTNTTHDTCTTTTNNNTNTTNVINKWWPAVPLQAAEAGRGSRDQPARSVQAADNIIIRIFVYTYIYIYIYIHIYKLVTVAEAAKARLPVRSVQRRGVLVLLSWLSVSLLLVLLWVLVLLVWLSWILVSRVLLTLLWLL